MDQTHIHLLITHLPIFGSILGGFVLAYAIWMKSDQTKIAAYCLLIISSAGAIIAYLTGEGAEETVEDIPGVSEGAIEQHEDFAIFALIVVCILGIASFVSLYLTLKKSPLTRNAALLTLALSIIGFAFMARTGYLGGQIRHTEIGSSVPASSQTEQDDDND